MKTKGFALIELAVVLAICYVAKLVLVAVILLDSVRIWLGILNGGRRQVHEAPFVVSRLQAEEL